MSAGIQLPVADPAAPVTVEGEHAVRWQEGSAEVWVIRNAAVRQDQMTAHGTEAVLWIAREPTDNVTTIIAYFEGDVAIDFLRPGNVHPGSGQAAQSIRDHTWFGRLETRRDVDLQVAVAAENPYAKPAVYEHARQAWDAVTGPVQQAQFAAEPIAPPPLAPILGASKRVQVGPRSNTLYNVKSFPGQQPDQSVTVFSNGIRAVIEGAEAPQLGDLGRIVIETDRLVLWGPNPKTFTASNTETQGGAGVPIELYMEGNIVFRQADRLIFADRMYYNATHEYGMVLSAEVVTPVPEYAGLVRLKADVLQQLNAQHFRAYGAAATSSQMGVPKYWVQAQQIDFQDTQQPLVNPLTGQPVYDPKTQQGAVEHDLLATSRNNFVYVSGVPVLYWPVLATDLRKPTYYLDRLTFKNDNVFGTQIRTRWDAFQVFRFRHPPAGTDWTVDADWLSDRGLGIGTTVDYDRADCLSLPGPVHGMLTAWGLHDDGFDNLGANRRRLVPEEDWRGRLLWWHRHDLPSGFQFMAEAGWISDRNFLEQYYEREWDEWKDEVTRFELKNTQEEQSLRIFGSVRVNDFFTQTGWYPRADHFLLGRSLLYDRLTWFSHTQGGYAQMKVADAPQDPQDAAGWALLGWEQDVEGWRAATRQELDLPVQAGPFKVVPYVTGELAYWSEVLNGQQDVSRATGQAGLRVSVPIWKANPTVQSPLFNVNGVAHKITVAADFLWADSSEDLGQFPLYDPVDDDSQEHFRRRFGPIPRERDERWYLFRSGLQSWVTAPSTEVTDDLTMIRTGLYQRWQTKRGVPGRERVIDWIVLDLDANVYPDATRDNFGECLGQLQYDFRWHLGDRLTLLSDGYADTFRDGLRTFSLGGAISRPDRGRLYLGFTSMEGPFTSSLLTGSLSYRISEKWIGEAAAVYDLGPTGKIGERFAITRVGESALIRVGVYGDHSRDNVGASISIEPRFLPRSRLGRVAGVQIPPVGAEGLD